MADVTGPIGSLPNSTHTAAGNCDEHPDRPAYRRIQGETDSFGSEMHDLCKECYDAHIEAVNNADTSGVCDWCNQHKPALRNRRDFEEGMSGRVYEVCSDCIKAENARIQEEFDDDDYDDYHD
jgi:hypothetical protein